MPRATATEKVVSRCFLLQARWLRHVRQAVFLEVKRRYKNNSRTAKRTHMMNPADCPSPYHPTIFPRYSTTNEPASPSSTVTIDPPGSSLDMRSLVMAPTIKPINAVKGVNIKIPFPEGRHETRELAKRAQSTGKIAAETRRRSGFREMPGRGIVVGQDYIPTRRGRAIGGERSAIGKSEKGTSGGITSFDRRACGSV